MTDIFWGLLGFIFGAFFRSLGDDLYASFKSKWKQFRSPYKEIKHNIKGYYFTQPKPRRIWHKGYFKKLFNR